MIVDTCIVSSNLNPFYYDFYPIVRRAWKELCNVRCFLLLIADHIPQSLQPYEEDIILFPPIPNTSDILVSQIIRILYAGLLPTNNAVITSDVDILPLSSKYFIDSTKNVDENKFVNYRFDTDSGGQLLMCYNAAPTKVWKDIFGCNNVDDVKNKLIEYDELCKSFKNTRMHGDGWFTDQVILTEKVMEKISQNPSVIHKLNDRDTNFRRLDRHDNPNENDLKNERYADYHMPRPFEAYKVQITNIVDSLLLSRK